MRKTGFEPESHNGKALMNVLETFPRDELFQILGGPCMGVYALSNSPGDILVALKAGHSFIRFAPRGPEVELQVGEAIMGDCIEWQEGMTMEICADHLKKDDILRVVTHKETSNLLQAPTGRYSQLTYLYRLSEICDSLTCGPFRQGPDTDNVRPDRFINSPGWG